MKLPGEMSAHGPNLCQVLCLMFLDHGCLGGFQGKALSARVAQSKNSLILFPHPSSFWVLLIIPPKYKCVKLHSIIGIFTLGVSTS